MLHFDKHTHAWRHLLMNLTFLGCLVLGLPTGFLTGADRRCAVRDTMSASSDRGTATTNCETNIFLCHFITFLEK